MQTKEIRRLAQDLKRWRAATGAKEDVLRSVINEELKEHGEAILFASVIDVKPQYLSDIRKGRRNISDKVLASLCSLKDKKQ